MKKKKNFTELQRSRKKIVLMGGMTGCYEIRGIWCSKHIKIKIIYIKGLKFLAQKFKKRVEHILVKKMFFRQIYSQI